VENQATVRAAAKKFGISKSTVHMDVSERLRNIQPQLYSKVRAVLDINKSQRHIRGGLATREKYRMEEE
jgi:putative DeoR family transcriptional regulator (stage III sporulation protein D)